VSGLHRPSCYLSPALKRQSSQSRFFARRRARLISRPARGTANPLSWLDSAARRKPGSARRGARPTGRVKNAPTRLSLQTVDDQRRELTDACDRRGWQVVAKFCDEGVSSPAPRGATSADFDHCTRRSCATSLISSPRGRLTGSAAAYRILSAFSAKFTQPGLTFTSIAKVSIPARRPAKRCSSRRASYRSWLINGYGGAEPHRKLDVSVILQADAEPSR
jgi:hypothetical protein